MLDPAGQSTDPRYGLIGMHFFLHQFRGYSEPTPRRRQTRAHGSLVASCTAGIVVSVALLTRCPPCAGITRPDSHKAALSAASVNTASDTSCDAAAAVALVVEAAAETAACSGESSGTGCGLRGLQRPCAARSLQVRRRQRWRRRRRLLQRQRRRGRFRRRRRGGRVPWVSAATFANTPPGGEATLANTAESHPSPWTRAVACAACRAASQLRCLPGTRSGMALKRWREWMNYPPPPLNFPLFPNNWLLLSLPWSHFSQTPPKP